MRRTAALLVLPLVLALGACGDEETEPAPDEASLADVSVSGEFGEEPTVDFNAPVVFPKTTSEVLEEGPGTGPAVSADSTVEIDYYGMVARDGSVFANSFEAGSPATFQLGQVIPGLVKGLSGSQAGDRVVIAVNSKDGYDPTGNGETVLEGDSLVFVVDVHDVSNPVALTDAQVPTLETDKDGTPTGFTPTESSPERVDGLTVKVLEEGDGPVVEAGQTVTAEYLGQVYPDGNVFDESYSRKEPTSFSLSGVIPGWQEGLPGVKVGSRIVLVIPADQGYGAAGSGEDIPPDSDLIFVIDVEKAE